MQVGRMIVAASIVTLAACDVGTSAANGSANAGVPAGEATVARVEPVPAASATSVAVADAWSDGPRSCAASIGAATAAERVAVCRNVSPATRPPCNAANSCAMIEDEIARSCALFDGDGKPMAGCSTDPKGMQAAADVVRRYYSAIDARDYATAWQQWGDDGRPGQSFAAFEKGFAQTRSTRVTIGAMEPGDGGAGSVYQPVPVTVEAVLDDGTRQRFTGNYVVRRVNGVDGAAPWQLRWHLDSATLRRVSAG